MPDKKAIRDLMSEIAAAETPRRVYEVALRCLQSTLKVERASMLLLDEQQRMRFVASSGLSEAYRAAVDGHSPWSPDDADPEVVLVENVRETPALAALQAVLLADRIEACAFVPLRFQARLLGKFMLYYDSPHAFSQDEVALAEIVAGHVAFALEHRRIAAELEERLASEREARERAELEAALREESERAAERARRRLQVLAELTEDLASELEPAAALQRLAQKVVESMADYCVTYSYDGASIAREGFAHRLAEKNELVRRLSDSGPPGLDDAIGVGAVIRSGTPTLATGLTPERIQETGLHPEHKKVVLALEPRSAMIVPLRSRGHPVGAITFATTADSERQYDSSDVDLAVELANRVALFIDNAQLYTEAKAAVAARDEMIRVVSHDLRNRLQSIATAAALLQRGGPPERRDRTLETISLATTQMKRLLQDLLDMSQMEAGQFFVAVERVDSAALIREAHTLFVSVAEEKKIRLEWRASPAVPIRADYDRIVQVLANLISNALKFVPAGGTVTLGAERYGERVRFFVSDTGIGLSAEDQARVFDRFWRGDRRKDRGAGLGLALAKGIIEAHGGEIGVESVLGRGSTFYFILDADAADGAAASGLTGGSTIRILGGEDALGEAMPNMPGGGAAKPH